MMQSALLAVAVAGCCTKGLKNASFVEEECLRCGMRSRREILITVGSYQRCPAGLCSSSSEEVSQRTTSVHIPGHCFAQQRRTQCLVPRRCSFTHLFWYLVQLTILCVVFFCGRGFFRGTSRPSAALFVAATVEW